MPHRFEVPAREALLVGAVALQLADPADEELLVRARGVAHHVRAIEGVPGDVAGVPLHAGALGMEEHPDADAHGERRAPADERTRAELEQRGGEGSQSRDRHRAEPGGNQAGAAEAEHLRRQASVLVGGGIVVVSGPVDRDVQRHRARDAERAEGESCGRDESWHGPVPSGNRGNPVSRTSVRSRSAIRTRISHARACMLPRARAGVAELVDAPDLGSGEHCSWRFKSSRPHAR